jgi:hypothetical protein
MDYLSLVQALVRESGTMSGVAVTTVSGQTGRQLKCVDWISNAYVTIQNRQKNWLWMMGEWSHALTIGTARYTAAALGLTRHRRWITGDQVMTLYDPAIGVADEGAITEISWETWRRKYGRGTQTAARPIEYAVSPAGEMCFGPFPDKAYVVGGEYYKSAQVLAANTDTPEMPEDHHMLIVWEALLTLDEHDEASVSKAFRRSIDAGRALDLDQLPTITIGGGPLA